MDQEKLEETKIKEEQIKKEIEIFNEYQEILKKDQLRGFQITVNRIGKEIVSIESPYKEGRKFYLKDYTPEQQKKLEEILRIPIEKTKRVTGGKINKKTYKKTTIIAKRHLQVKIHFPEFLETARDISYLLN
jgi:hypothetical protein